MTPASLPRQRLICLAIFACNLLSSCGGGSQSGPPAVPAPSNLTYSQTTMTAVVGQAVTPNNPSVTGNVTSYSVTPSLPQGLSLNVSTGTISGVATTAAPTGSYVVAASNAGGSTQITLQITV